MGYQEMSPAQIHEFLIAGARPAVLGTTRKDGRPHVAPVWYAVDGTADAFTIVFNTGAETVKGRILRRTGQAALTVQDDQPPFSFATVDGTVELIDDLAQVREWAGLIGGRYMGADRADEFGERNGVPGELLVRLTPTSMRGALDLAD